jgi:iron complex outermembrane receptor protein
MRQLASGHRSRRLVTLVVRCLAVSLVAIRLGGAQSSAGLPGTATTLSGRVVEVGSNRPVQGAAVFVAGTQRGTISRGDGSYRLALAPGRVEVTVRLIGYATARATLDIAPGGAMTRDFALAKAPLSLEAVAVTGSRRATERTVTEAPVPIDVISASDIRATGRTEIAQMIQALVPSLNFPRSSIAGGVDMQRPFTLRGLGPDQALVLINGKRRHAGAVVAVNNSVGRGSTGVDLNAIPAAAIERIEVLRDGAAAQYGSDAIAGVINVILKESAPPTISTTLGRTSRHDGQVAQVDGSYSHAFGSRGFVTLTGEYRDRARTNRAETDTRVQYFTKAQDDSIAAGLPVTVGGQLITADMLAAIRDNSWYGDSWLHDVGAFYNAGTTLESGMGLYAFGGATRRFGRAWGFNRRPGEPVVVRGLYPTGFLPIIDGTVIDYSTTGGAKGLAGGWNYDLSAALGTNSFRFDVRNTNNPTYGLASPSDFYAGKLTSRQLTANLDLSHPFAMGLPAPVNLAFGAEARLDGYRIDQGQVESYSNGGSAILDGPSAGRPATPGAQLFYGFKPADETNTSRNSVAAYVDVEGNLTSAFTLDLAGRTERFSDFGSATIGKVAARYQLPLGFSLRAAANTGFRAPSLAQSVYSSTASNVLFVGGVPTPNEVATYPVSSDIAKALGAKPLQAETSRNVSAGATWAPVPAFSATFDYFDITITDRIVLSENFVGTQVRAFLRNNFNIIGDIRPRYFTNAVDTKTTGADLVVRYLAELAPETILRSTLGLNRNHTDITRVTPAPPELVALGQSVLFGRVEINRSTEVQPRSNARINLNFQRRNVSIDVEAARYGEFTIRPDLTGNPANDQTFGAKTIADLSLTYRVGASGVTIGADNIFDVLPDRNIAINTVGGTKPYSEYTPFGQNGRFVFLRLGYAP